MNANAQELTVLSLDQRAVVALGQKDNEKALVKMARQTRSLVTITNKDGLDQVHAGRMALKNQRIEIQRIGKAARDDATKFSKAVIAEENRLIALIQPEEERLGAIQKAYEDKLAAEEEAKVQAELARVARHQEGITDIRNAVISVASAGSERIAAQIEKIESLDIGAGYEEFEQEAQDAKTATLFRLNELHVAAVAREEAARQFERDRIELAKLREEAAERERQEFQRRADEEQAAKARRDAEEAEMRQRREAMAKQEADLKARQAALDRAEAERAEAARLAALPPPAPEVQPEPQPEPVAQAEPVSAPVGLLATIVIPGYVMDVKSMVDLLKDHYQVSTDIAELWIITAGEALKRRNAGVPS